MAYLLFQVCDSSFYNWILSTLNSIILVTLYLLRKHLLVYRSQNTVSNLNTSSANDCCQMHTYVNIRILWCIYLGWRYTQQYPHLYVVYTLFLPTFHLFPSCFSDFSLHFFFIIWDCFWKGHIQLPLCAINLSIFHSSEHLSS